MYARRMRHNTNVALCLIPVSGEAKRTEYHATADSLTILPTFQDSTPGAKFSPIW